MEFEKKELKEPYLKLKIFLLENNIKRREVADVIGVGPSLLSQKINQKNSDFTLVEASAICSRWGLNLHEYFFVSDFSKMRNGKEQANG